jgi:hypothetical protein
MELAPRTLAPYLDGMRVAYVQAKALAAAIYCLAALVLGGTPAAQAESDNAPVLVELFTSQGCYSCPPADRLLGQLAAEGNVVALAFHVTYWDRLGWPDPFGSEAGTKRQYRYGQNFRSGSVYTPQLVIDGQSHEVGSNETRVRAAIRAARRQAHPAAPTLQWLPDHSLQVTLPDAAEAAGATIWLAQYDRKQQTDILRGENGGKRLDYHQIVRDQKVLGVFDGKSQTLRTSVQPLGQAAWGVAVIVQQRGQQRVWGAALLDAPKPDA